MLKKRTRRRWGGSPQSSNVDGVAVDAGEIWVVIGGGEGANDLGAATNEAVLSLEAEEGWPVAAAAAEVVAVEAEEVTADVPKTGETATLPVILLALVMISVVGITVKKKKVNTNEN